MLSNVECIFLKPACEGEIRLTSSANEFNRLFNILVKTSFFQNYDNSKFINKYY